jgi:hypothetical protein
MHGRRVRLNISDSEIVELRKEMFALIKIIVGQGIQPVRCSKLLSLAQIPYLLHVPFSFFHPPPFLFSVFTIVQEDIKAIVTYLQTEKRTANMIDVIKFLLSLFAAKVPTGSFISSFFLGLFFFSTFRLIVI